jgi:ABC-type nitrate/sulfonate/bicarbonate transport system substrate-binding protein
MKASYCIVAVLVAALMAGCGESAAPGVSTQRAGSDDTAGSATPVAQHTKAPPLPPEIRVSLDGHMGAQNIGLLMAEKLGFFKDAGLSVWLGSPLRPSNTVSYVLTRMDEIGVVQLPQVAIARENGIPIEAVGSVISHPTAAMIWLKESGIETMDDLKGKTIGLPGIPFQEDLLGTVLEDVGLTLDDVDVQPLGYLLVPALLSARVDAIFGGSWNLEGAALEARGVEPVIKRVQTFGVPAYDELAVVTRSDRAAADPRMIRAFMSAVRRGTAAALRDPKEALRLLVKGSEVDEELTPEEIEAQLDATLPLLSKDGYIDPQRAVGLIDWMEEQGWIEKQMPVAELLTNGLPHP